MNRPFKITPIAAAPVPASAPSPVVGAGAPAKMVCLECGGEGTGEYMALDETDYHVRRCHVCHGSGLVDPYCETCQGKLTVDGYCYACDDWGSLIYVERIAPGRVAL